MNKSTKIVLFSIIILFIAGIILYPTVKKSFNKENALSGAPASSGPGGGRGAPLNINAKIIKPETLTDNIIGFANIYPDEEVNLTFETSGKITDIFFKEGTAVKKGELLAKVNDKPLLAELQKLEAQVPLAEGRVFRQKSLLEKDAVSQEAYEQVTTELDKLHADIDLVKARIAQTELRAPFDGVIGLRTVSEGAYASPSTIIARLTKVIPLKIEFSMPERHLNAITPGTNVIFKTSDDTPYTATIYAIESHVDVNTHTLKAKALYPNTNGKLKPGVMVSLDILSNEIKNALVVPNESVVAEMGRDIAYIYSGGKARQVELKKGIRTESNVQILDGLNPGDTLIISGVMQLRNGLPVTIDNIQ
ncbi:MexH family multidrug efflux RND transporter periplasmic adaptor subunit [Bacteroidia bacterium]|nr:MexH family multidrug efflux RND transporter periplasmic adaptor subunit [Bacteroidia bacterium]GHT26271.1 MexH family multidrug efflux RND transporter periplasmic adaptor subunit [Bacteroidia bacterium]